MNLSAGKKEKWREKKGKERNLNMPVLSLGRDFIVPSTPIHLGDIYHLIFEWKIYGQ